MDILGGDTNYALPTSQGPIPATSNKNSILDLLSDIDLSGGSSGMPLAPSLFDGMSSGGLSTGGGGVFGAGMFNSELLTTTNNISGT